MTVYPPIIVGPQSCIFSSPTRNPMSFWRRVLNRVNTFRILSRLQPLGAIEPFDPFQTTRYSLSLFLHVSPELFVVLISLFHMSPASSINWRFSYRLCNELYRHWASVTEINVITFFKLVLFFEFKIYRIVSIYRLDTTPIAAQLRFWEQACFRADSGFRVWCCGSDEDPARKKTDIGVEILFVPKRIKQKYSQECKKLTQCKFYNIII